MSSGCGSGHHLKVSPAFKELEGNRTWCSPTVLVVPNRCSLVSRPPAEQRRHENFNRLPQRAPDTSRRQPTRHRLATTLSTGDSRSGYCGKGTRLLWKGQARRLGSTRRRLAGEREQRTAWTVRAACCAPAVALRGCALEAPPRASQFLRRRCAAWWPNCGLLLQPVRAVICQHKGLPTQGFSASSSSCRGPSPELSSTS